MCPFATPGFHRATFRVAVWSTGGVGSIAIRAIHRHRDMELVGVWVHTPEKVGRDAGELAGAEPIGLTATDDADALIALRPDCVVYAASGPQRDAGAMPDYARLLEAGINVVTTTATGLVYPRLGDLAQRPLPGRLRDDGRHGIRPTARLRAAPGQARIHRDGRAPIELIARGLGVELDEVRGRLDRSLAQRDIEVAFGTIPAGTCGAVRTSTMGIVDGREAIVIEHVIRMGRDVAPGGPGSDTD